MFPRDFYEILHIIGIAMLCASVIAGGLWDQFGPQATFLAGAAFAAIALAGLATTRVPS